MCLDFRNIFFAPLLLIVGASSSPSTTGQAQRACRTILYRYLIANNPVMWKFQAGRKYRQYTVHITVAIDRCLLHEIFPATTQLVCVAVRVRALSRRPSVDTNLVKVMGNESICAGSRRAVSSIHMHSPSQSCGEGAHAPHRSCSVFVFSRHIRLSLSQMPLVRE